MDTPDGRGTVVEVDLLRQRVKVKMENQPEVIGTYANADIAVLRNGKAKKTDAPIPEDLAPISGSKKQTKEEPEDRDTPVLDSIRFRYSTETIVQEQSIPETEPEPKTEPDAELTEETAHKHTRPRRKNRKPRQTPPKPAEETPPEAPQKAAAPAAEKADATEADGEKAKKPHRRPPYRRRRPHHAGVSTPKE